MKQLQRPKLTRKQLRVLIKLMDEQPGDFGVFENGSEISTAGQEIVITQLDKPTLRVRFLADANYNEAELGRLMSWRLRMAIRRWFRVIDLKTAKNKQLDQASVVAFAAVSKRLRKPGATLRVVRSRD